MILRLPDTVVLSNSKPLDNAIKIISKHTRPLDYATIKITLSTPAVDNAIIKLWRKHTHTTMGPWHAPFPTEHAGIILVTLRRRQKMAELWRFEDGFYSHIHKFCQIKY